jgi:5-methylcytosine-specific restriction endonuclease McrA
VTVPNELRERIRMQAGDRCGYCLSAQRYVFAPLEIDHLLPTARAGTDDEENLWLACRMCNGFKSDHTHGHDPITGERNRPI